MASGCVGGPRHKTAHAVRDGSGAAEIAGAVECARNVADAIQRPAEVAGTVQAAAQRATDGAAHRTGNSADQLRGGGSGGESQSRGAQQKDLLHAISPSSMGAWFRPASSGERWRLRPSSRLFRSD